MKKELSVIKNKRGFSLAEAIIATAILMIIVTSVSASYISIKKYIISAAVQARAISLADEGLEAARNIRDKDFTLLVSGSINGLSQTGNIWNFAGAQDVNGIYTRKISITTPAVDTRLVSAKIDWTYDGAAKTITLEREFTNWRKSKAAPLTNPVSRWPFDENTGCVALDTSGTNPGNLMPVTCPINSPAWIGGKLGLSALNFNASASHNFVQVADANSLDLSIAGTIMLWIYPTSNSNMGILHKGAASNGSDEAYYMKFDSGGSITTGGRNTANNQFSIQTTNANIALNTWSHVVFTWDANGMKIYINGVLGTTANTTVLNARNSAGSLQIGGYYASSNANRFRGRIDEVSIYNTAISASEILTIYNSQK